MGVSISKAKKFAIEHHGLQLYGGFLYEKHLSDVENVLIRFGVDDIALRAAAWLHDILEDTTVTYDMIYNEFGEKVFNLVYAVTDDIGVNRKQRKYFVYNKLNTYPYAIKLKLADRIANLEWSLLTNIRKLKMYLKEHSSFRDNLLIGETDVIMWNHLDYLIDLGQFAMKRADIIL